MKFNLCKLFSEDIKQKENEENLKFLRFEKMTQPIPSSFILACCELSEKVTMGIHVGSCYSTGLGLGNHTLEQWSKGQRGITHCVASSPGAALGNNNRLEVKYLILQ